MATVHDLKKQVLLQDLDDRDLQKIADKLVDLSFKRGDYIYREGEERRGLYLINTGSVEVTSTALGIEFPLFTRGPGEFFGTHAVFGEKKHGTNARALEDLVAYVLPVEDFESLEHEDVIVAYFMMKNLAYVMSRTQLAMSRKINELTTMTFRRFVV
ncbi:MAG TPA: cyclic nucleotide-binding domain-containing protein [Dissulfurispiraceae bacterium]|nr:cyclic nucleotide-binding domain-containing protein [Dissulfurispiraceae bacterium]